MEILLLLLVAGLLIVVVALLFIFRNKGQVELPQLQQKVAELQSSLTKLEAGLKEDFRINREENAAIAKDNRIELNTTLRTITEQSQLALKEINKTLDEKIGALIGNIEQNNKTNREELTNNITGFSNANILQLEKINNQAKDDQR